MTNLNKRSNSRLNWRYRGSNGLACHTVVLPPKHRPRTSTTPQRNSSPFPSRKSNVTCPASHRFHGQTSALAEIKRRGHLVTLVDKTTTGSLHLLTGSIVRTHTCLPSSKSTRKLRLTSHPAHRIDARIHNSPFASARRVATQSVLPICGVCGES